MPAETPEVGSLEAFRVPDVILLALADEVNAVLACVNAKLAKIDAEFADREIKLAHVAFNTVLNCVCQFGLAASFQRIVKLFEAKNHIEMSNYLSNKFKEKPGVVDVILWRLCAKNGWKNSGFEINTQVIQEYFL